MVKFIRRHFPDNTTLAIGDGANDVNMINEAHPGVGIMGKEGNQAAQFSDYAVPRFNSLRRLLLWHGRNWAERVQNYTMWCFFKGMIFAFSSIMF